MFIWKGSYRYGEPKNVIGLSVQKTYWPLRACKIPGFMQCRHRADKGNLRKFGAADHNGTVIAPKQLMFIWKGSYGYGESKNVIGLSMQKNLLAVTGQQTIRFHAELYRAENGNLGIFGTTCLHGTGYAPKPSFYQKEATGMETIKM